MILNTLRLRNFRNYIDSFFEFDKNVNVICGENAQGKTNCLEAVYFISTLKSFRMGRFRKLFYFDRDYA